MLESEYNYAVRQSKVNNYLGSLRVTSFASQGTEMSDALAKVYNSIIKLSRQAPRYHQGDAHKVEFLRNAVVGTPWSNEPLSRVATHQLTFQRLYAEVEAALQLHKKPNLAMLRARAQLGRRTLPEDDSARIMYAGQGRCYHVTASSQLGKARKPYGLSSVPRGTGAKPARTGQFDPLSIFGCFNCGGSHLLKDCTLPLNKSRAAAQKMDYYSKKANTKTHRGASRSSRSMPTVGLHTN